MYNWGTPVHLQDDTDAEWPTDRISWAPGNKCMGKFCGGEKYKYVKTFKLGAYFEARVCEKCAAKLAEALLKP